MEVGSKEWIEKVNEHYSFPCKIAFILIKECDDSTQLYSTEIKSRCRIENVKYSHISKDTWTSKGSAVLSVKEISSAEEYLEEVKRLKRIWGFALIDKENKEENK